MRNIVEYTDFYMKEGFEKYQVEFRRRNILEMVEKCKPKSILEIGCGMEPLFLYYSDAEYTIVEPSEKFVINAKSLVTNEKVLIYQNFIEEISKCLKPEYDMIICSSLLHEVQEPEKLVEVIYALCNTETIVHINVPNANSFHRLLAKESGLINDIYEKSKRNIELQQNMIFDLDSLKQLALNSGFRIQESGSYFVKPFTHEQMMILLESGVDERILLGMEKMIKYMPNLGSEIFINCQK